MYIRKSNTYLLPCKCFLFYPDLCQVLKKSGWSVAEELVDVFNKITDEQINIDSKDFNDEEKLEDYCKVYPITNGYYVKIDYLILQQSMRHC